MSLRPKPFSPWIAALSACRDRRLLLIAALGFGSGLPAPLLFANLSIWLTDSGIGRAAAAAVGTVTLPYAVNFLWAPVFDRLPPPPPFSRLGLRRGWLALLLILLAIALLALALTGPGHGLAPLAVAAAIAAFVSASLDVVVDGVRVDLTRDDAAALGSAAGVFGWHLGGTVAGGAGGLLLAARFGWPAAYAVLAAALALPLLALSALPEPVQPPRPRTAGGLGAALAAAAVEPLKKLAERPRWAEILAFVVIFKLGDAMLGRMSGIFYRELSFDYVTIAEVTKLYGLAATVVGGLAGGILLRALGVGRGLFAAGIAMAATNLLYAGLAAHPDRGWLILAVTGDGFTGGLAAVGFVAFLTRLCSTGYAATHYALLASLGTLARVVLAGGSGWVVDALGGDWGLFFTLTALAALPGLALLAHLIRCGAVAEGPVE